MEQRLSAFSDQLADRVAHAAPGLVTLFPGTRAQRTGFAWGPNLVVTSEQNLPHETEVQIVLPGGGTATARMAGRDNGTNVAVLALPIEAPTMTDAVPRVGGLALALGAAEGGPTASMGLVHQVGPAWDSMAGGTIDHLVRLDLRLSAAAEGGPVLDGAGALLGMSTFGPRRRVLVIPAATIRRVLPALAEGRAARGWMGVALQPVQLPPALAETAGRETGLLVASLAKDGPAARAGVHPGDILLAVAGAAATHPRATARALGQHAAGQAVGLDLLRGGSPLHLSVTLEARPPRMMLTLAPPRALSIAVTARDPVRAADLAARVTLAGHTVVEPDAAPDLVLADAASPVAPDQAVLRMGLGAPLPAELSPVQLDAALRAVAVGLRVSLPHPEPEGFAAAEARPLLTPRELEILACLGEGLSNKAVARRLGISAHTVKFHLEAVFAKLGATSRADAVARGLRGGLILL